MVIPILNEATALGRTLWGIVNQDYPAALVEILVIDGGSTDDWRQALRVLDGSPIRCRVLDNPKRSTAAAVNLALSTTDADAILWISGHVVLAPDYLVAAASVFAERPRQVVGGRLNVKGEGWRGWLNAMVLSSRFGTGMAPLRFGREVGETRSVTFALYDRRQLLALGGLDERLDRNQDIDIWDRLRRDRAVFRRVDSVATYLAPRTFSGFWRRAWKNGAWNIWGQHLRPGGLSWWHLAPMAMVGAGAALAAAACVTPVAALILTCLACAYGLLAFASATLVAVSRRALWAIPALPFLFLMHHLVYGLGSWQALVCPVPPNRRSRHTEAASVLRREPAMALRHE